MEEWNQNMIDDHDDYETMMDDNSCQTIYQFQPDQRHSHSFLGSATMINKAKKLHKKSILG